MSSFEYTAIPAPLRGEKAKGVKAPTDRYALTLSAAINDMAAQGWEYLRAETLPSEERSGLTGRTTVFHNLLIFRRPAAGVAKQPAAAAETPAEQPAAPAPVISAPVPAPDVPAPDVPAAPADTPPAAAGEAAADTTGPDHPPSPSPIFSEPMRIAEKPAGEAGTDHPAPNRLGPAS
ncbi:MAG: DUF4177 domain-containing protein [Paracoccus sp. (in: a-proteobacteria)]|nr:DUF4177 domain-containing protein [Paracoccus sp. (in: a-proteobacteria)]